MASSVNHLPGPIYLQFWPVADQDIVDHLSRDHWFSQNYHRLLRTPTRQELCSPYMPIDIIENRPEVLHQRLREALAFILREAVIQEAGHQAGEATVNHVEQASEGEDMDIIEEEAEDVAKLQDGRDEGEL
jgi:hypothetical protein